MKEYIGIKRIKAEKKIVVGCENLAALKSEGIN